MRSGEHAIVNAALAEHVERLGRLATLRQLLDRWDAEAGPVNPEARADAAAAFDEIDDIPRPAAAVAAVRIVTRPAR